VPIHFNKKSWPFGRTPFPDWHWQDYQNGKIILFCFHADITVLKSPEFCSHSRDKLHCTRGSPESIFVEVLPSIMPGCDWRDFMVLFSPIQDRPIGAKDQRGRPGILLLGKRRSRLRYGHNNSILAPMRTDYVAETLSLSSVPRGLRCHNPCTSRCNNSWPVEIRASSSPRGDVGMRVLRSPDSWR
jgi:hypothetical protein